MIIRKNVPNSIKKLIDSNIANHIVFTKFINYDSSNFYKILNYKDCMNEKDRKIVTDLLKGVKEKVFPVGRLDYNTQGLLLLTNDGMWANNIIHPSKHIYKTYEVSLKVMLTGKQLNQIRKGRTL